MRFTNFLSRMSRHADLFEAMTQKLGVKDRLLDLNNSASVFRRANARCLTCGHAEQCSAWLDMVEEPEAAPDYCRNKSLFARLERQPEFRTASDCHGSERQGGGQAL